MGEEVLDIKELNSSVTVTTDKAQYKAKDVVVCSPDVIANMFDIPITTGFAPMAVVENVPTYEKSFVELDYYVKSCINLLKKEDSVGLAGGVTVNKEDEIKPYLEYIIAEHKKRNPEIKVIDTYIGLKKELATKGQERNYLYHINQRSSHVWTVVLGKFTLAFSMAPEFYRRVYHDNPSRINDSVGYGEGIDLISDTAWKEIVMNNKERES